MAELMPPVLSYNLRLVNLVDAPQVSIAVFVEINRLENMLIKVHFGGELRLVVCAVEAHLELGLVLVVHFDVVHGLEVLFGVLVARRLVDVGELGDDFGRVVEVLVVVFHILAVPVCDGDVVGEFGGAEDFTFAEGGGGLEDAFGCVGAGVVSN